MKVIGLMMVLAACRGTGGVLIDDSPVPGPSTADTGATGNDTGPNPTTSTGSVRVEAILSLVSSPSSGSFLFTQQCLQCHPAPGATNPLGYPPLEDEVPLYTDGQLVYVVLEGVADEDGQSAMPAYAEFFTNQDVADVVAYLRLTYGAGRR